jgi:hypothetical protein
MRATAGRHRARPARPPPARPWSRPRHICADLSTPSKGLSGRRAEPRKKCGGAVGPGAPRAAALAARTADLEPSHDQPEDIAFWTGTRIYQPWKDVVRAFNPSKSGVATMIVLPTERP